MLAGSVLLDAFLLGLQVATLLLPLSVVVPLMYIHLCVCVCVCVCVFVCVCIIISSSLAQIGLGPTLIASF